jgi:hypothetical protein
MSVVLLICGAILIILGLTFCFFGYRFARLLFPVCGLIAIEGLLYIYIYGLFNLDALGTWLFFGGSSVAVYILLFFVRRIAGCFTGLLGSAIFLWFTVNALSLQNLSFLYPACMALCLVSAMLAVTYERVGVVVFTSLFGACAAVFAGLYLYMQGVGTGFIDASGGVFAAFQRFLSINPLLITGVSAVVAAAGILIQFKITATRTVLPGGVDEQGIRRNGRRPVLVQRPPHEGGFSGGSSIDGQY